MRIHWRIISLLVGFSLIGVVLLAVPYFSHLLHPSGPSQEHMVGAPPCRAVDYAISPKEQQIDELGVPEHIRTEADARAYVEALVKIWDPGETNPHLAEFEDQLARAEFAAVRDPQKLIPESQIVKTFNHLMDEWQMPGWAHISVPELHAFRVPYACGLYPRSVARLPDGTIAPSTRPTEALFLLHMLDSNGGIAPYLRDYIRQTRFPWNALKRFKLWHPVPIPTRLPPGLYARSLSEPEDFQLTKYDQLRRCYFDRHPDAASFEHIVNELFSQLGIQRGENL
jgi:hypothetical protein